MILHILQIIQSNLESVSKVKSRNALHTLANITVTKNDNEL